MSNLKQKHKDYLIKNEIKDLTDLVNYVEILRNTSNLQGEDRQMLFDFAFLITNEQLSLKSFFAENFRQELYNQLGIINDNVNVKSSDSCFSKTSDIIDEINTMDKNPSKEFYNAFKQTTSSPTFMDEVLEQANKEKWNPLNELHERAGREMFNTIKDEDVQFNSTRHKSKEGETHTEIPNFNESVGFQMKRGRNIIYKPTQQSGVKETENKTDYSEIDFDILDLMAERFNANKHKYPKGNMLKPIDEKELLFAGFRHLKKMIQPIEGDEETFLQHLSSVLCNMQMVYQQIKLKKC